MGVTWRGIEIEKRDSLYSQKLLLSEALREGLLPLFPRGAPRNQLCLFSNPCSDHPFSSFQRSRRRQASLQGQCRPWQRRAGLCPGAYWLPSYPPEGAQDPAGAWEELAEQRDAGSQEAGRIYGFFPRSREKQEKPVLLRRRTSEEQDSACAQVGAGELGRSTDKAPAAWGAEAHVCLAGTSSPGNYGLKNP